MPQPAQPPVVLLIEDDDLTCVSEALSLRRAGYQVFTASSWLTASRLLERLQPDLVVLDLNLPDGDGLQLGRTLTHARIPFIVVSGRADAVDRSQQAGARACLLKPVGLAELNLKVLLALRPPA